MEHLLTDCLKRVKTFSEQLNSNNNQQVNQLIAIYDKVKEIHELLEHYDGPDLLVQKQQELEWEKELIDVFGPRIMLYLLAKSLGKDNNAMEEA